MIAVSTIAVNSGSNARTLSDARAGMLNTIFGYCNYSVFLLWLCANFAAFHLFQYLDFTAVFVFAIQLFALRGHGDHSAKRLSLP